MMKEDQDKLVDLIRNYSVNDLFDSLRIAYKLEADNSSDMGLKNKAVEYAAVVDILDEICEVSLCFAE